jgi:tRNA-Thr(GGU) m(6)t(6)A37 methyltransferase TsaA
MTSPPEGLPNLTLTPIGVLRCAQAERVDAPRQPAAATSLRGIIELLPGQHYEHALEDLAGWERIWVIFWLHRNSGWRPKVLPPRSDNGRKGVFATRSPHRPNPLGLSALRLERVEGLLLHVRDVDLLDGTPILDIKPYVAYTDAFADARSGWLTPTADPTPAWQVVFSVYAESQLHWLALRSALPLRERALATLTLGPQPHPYRRIKQVGDGLMQLAIKDWRLLFSVQDRQITVQSLHSGYQAAQLTSARSEVDDGRQIHRLFVEAWPVP